MKLKLKLFVEHEGATFEFKYLDWVLPTAIEVFKGITEEQMDSLKAEMMDITIIPPNLIMICNDVFKESLIGWKDVFDEEDNPVEFSAETRELVDPISRLNIGVKILQEMIEIDEKKV